MYTEDDEKVTVKKDNSNVKDADFYTSFNDIEKENPKKKKNNKNKVAPTPKDTESKEESDYSDFYGGNEVVEEDNNKNNKGSIIKIVVIVLLAIILIGLVFILLNKKPKVQGDIELTKTSITLGIGEKEYISYSVVGTDKEAISKFTSSDDSIIIVNENGEIMGLSEGEAIVTISYTIDGVTREKKCTVKVNSSDINQNISLDLKFEKGKNDTWTNNEVVINPEASSIFEIVSIKYAVNCDKDCHYEETLNKKITISNSGESKIRVIAKDKKNQEITKEVIVKIDKEAPTATLVGSNNITSNKDVEVCVTCNDELSGCKQNKVCKKYSESKSNQVITVEDKAGNKKNSASFNVTIKKTTPCSLKVSSDGTVTATLNKSASYYGFNSSYSGNNETSKKITINASKNGESGAKVVYYYVKNADGNGICQITIIKKCSCPNNSTEANCPVTCTFTSK